MKSLLGIFCLLGVASAGLLINEINSSLGDSLLASCDIFKNDTQRANVFQDFFDQKVDENGDQSLSTQELRYLAVGKYRGFALLTTVYNVSYINYKMEEFDQDKNQEINGQEICDLLKYQWNELEEDIEAEKRKILKYPRSRLVYESFLNRLVSITKHEFIDWIEVVLREWALFTQRGDARRREREMLGEELTEWDMLGEIEIETRLTGEFLFLLADDDMSGELTHDENYVTFTLFKKLNSLPPFQFSKTANPKWLGIGEKLPLGLASCDTFKNDTKRVALLQDFSDKIDKNGDGSLSAKELTILPYAQYYPRKYGFCFDNYAETGWEYCKLGYGARRYDQDRNNEIFGEELCDFWKAVMDDFDQKFNYIRQVAIDDEKRFTYDEFSKNHPELISMNKEKAVDWLKNEYEKEMKEINEDVTTETSSLIAEFLFIFLDKDMSGVLDSYEENYLVFAWFILSLDDDYDYVYDY